MKEYNARRGSEARERVLAAIEQCKKENDISITRVCRLAGVHRSYFTKHPEMRETLNVAMKIVNRIIKKRKQDDNSKEVLMRTLQIQVDALKKKNASLAEDAKYKDMYKEKCEEAKKLKEQLHAQLNQNFLESGDLGF